MDPDNSDELAIWVEPVAELLEPGTTVWWHPRMALWTRQDCRFVDRIAYSFGPQDDPDQTYAEILVENLAGDQQDQRAQRLRRPS